MRILPPVSIEARRLLPSRWDLLAALLVLGFIILFADASRSLIQPISSITGHGLSLDPGLLPGYALRTALRTGRPAGVALDVYDTEPLPGDHWLRMSPRALLSPHMGYVTAASYRVFYADIVEDIAGIKLKRKYKLDAPKGVNGRNSENTLIKKTLGWEPDLPLRNGMEKTYAWIYDEMTKKK